MTHDLKLRLVWISPDADTLIHWSGQAWEAARFSFARFIVEPANEEVFHETARALRDIPVRVSWGTVHELNGAMVEQNTYVFGSIGDLAQHSGIFAEQIDQQLRPALPWAWPILTDKT